MAEVINREQVNIPRYRFVCFNCGAEVVYKKNEIHRNPGLSRVVRNHGYEGFTGEIHCPSCGTWLPHYDQNEVPAGYGVRQDQEAPKPQAAPAADAAGGAEMKHIFCIYCGKQLPEDAVFCGYCGKKIR